MIMLLLSYGINMGQWSSRIDDMDKMYIWYCYLMCFLINKNNPLRMNVHYPVYNWFITIKHSDQMRFGTWNRENMVVVVMFFPITTATTGGVYNIFSHTHFEPQVMLDGMRYMFEFGSLLTLVSLLQKSQSWSIATLFSW